MDTNRLAFLLDIFEQVPPGVDFQSYLLDGQQLALRLNRRDLALRLRARMVRHATAKEDIVAATRHAQALIREAQRAPAQYVDMALGANGLGEVAGVERRFADARKWFRLAFQYVVKRRPPAGAYKYWRYRAVI